MTSPNWSLCWKKSSSSAPKVSHLWFNRFRKILVRYEKLSDTYMALLHMAAAIIAYRKAGFFTDKY